LSATGSQRIKDNDFKNWSNPLIKMDRLSCILPEVSKRKQETFSGLNLLAQLKN